LNAKYYLSSGVNNKHYLVRFKRFTNAFKNNYVNNIQNEKQRIVKKHKIKNQTGQQPKITVVMSVFNDYKYLEESIVSVINQSQLDLEFIIVDDGSEDSLIYNTLSDFQKSDKRIKVIRKNNEGITKALIVACNEAQGKYIARIDVGDVMCLDRLEKQLKVFENNNDISLVSCWTQFCTPTWECMSTNTGKVKLETNLNNDLIEITDKNTGWNVSHHGSVMFSRKHYELVKGYRWQFYYGQDWDLWYRLCEIGEYRIVPEILYKARVFPSSISMTKKVQQEEIAKLSHKLSQGKNVKQKHILLETAARIRPGGLISSTDSYASGNYFIGKILWDNGSLACRKYFIQSIKQKLFNPKPLFFLFLSYILKNKFKYKNEI